MKEWRFAALPSAPPKTKRDVRRQMIEENYMVEKRKAEKNEQKSEREKRENGKMV